MDINILAPLTKETSDDPARELQKGSVTLLVSRLMATVSFSMFRLPGFADSQTITRNSIYLGKLRNYSPLGLCDKNYEYSHTFFVQRGCGHFYNIFRVVMIL
jgi:hypothetical protein